MPQEDIKILGRKGGEPLVSKEEGKSNLAGLLDMLGNKRKG
jgi:ATP-dependent DNA helicase rep